MKTTDKEYYVYKHTSPSGKVYIGITRQNPQKRWQYGHGYKKSKDTHFYNAIQKYGWNNIRHEILYCGLSKDEAEKKEIELISYYDSTDRNKGYNVSPGGGIVSKESIAKGLRTRKSNGTFAKASLRMRRLWEDEKWRENQVAKMQNKPRTEEQKKHYKKAAEKRIGTHLSQTAKEKLSQKASQRKCETSSRRKAVYQISPLDGSIVNVFCTARLAANSIGAKSISHISNTCRGANGKNQFAYGFYWCYAEDYETFIKNTSFGIEITQHGQIRKVPRVMCTETRVIYESIKEAAKQIGIKSPSEITRQIYGEQKTVGGYTFAFVSGEGKIISRAKTISTRTISEKHKEAVSAAHRKAVMCIETGIIYKSMTEAANLNGFKSRETIGRQISGKIKTAGGYTWKYVV